MVVFSPHPDDDVISMGGTFIRLCEQGHEVHVAYQTSGNIAVFDDAALRHADFVVEYSRAFNVGEKQAEQIEQHIENFVKRKKPGEVDSPELQQIKGLIRRTEARAAARFSGVRDENMHFLDMPFYETGRVRKKPLGEQDIQITMDLLEKVKPHQIYAAGDLRTPRHAPASAWPPSLRRPGSKSRGGSGSRSARWALPRRLARSGAQRHRAGRAPSPDERLRSAWRSSTREPEGKARFPGPADPARLARAEDRNRNHRGAEGQVGLRSTRRSRGRAMERGGRTDNIGGHDIGVCSWSLQPKETADLVGDQAARHWTSTTALGRC